MDIGDLAYEYRSFDIVTRDFLLHIKYNEIVYFESATYNILRSLDRDLSIRCVIIKADSISWSKLEKILILYPNTKYLFIEYIYLFGPSTDASHFINTYAPGLDKLQLFTYSELPSEVLDMWRHVVPAHAVHTYHYYKN